MDPETLGTTFEIREGATMEPPELVNGWLSRLGSADEPCRALALPQPDDEVDRTDRLPNTPKGKREATPRLEDASPTNTNFSSIFDSPGKDGMVGVGSLSSSYSSSSVADDSDWDPYCAEKDIEVVSAGHPTAIAAALEESASLNSIEPPSEGGSTLSLLDEKIADGIPACEQSTTTRHVFITSCYQCILAGLPCSRTLPACSRCQRAGCAPLCLLHRRKLTKEMIPGEPLWNRTPVLLKRRNDPEEIWTQKMKLLHEVSFLQSYRSGETLRYVDRPANHL
jgi:hypothetical protein